MRHANNGARAKFDNARSMRDRTVAFAAAFGVTGLALSQIGPWGADVRSKVEDRVGAVLPSQFVTVPVARAESSATAKPEAYWSAAHAVDRDLLTAWAAPWKARPDPKGTATVGCGRSDGLASITVTLTEPARVDRISISAGLPETSPQRPRQVLPRVVAIRTGTDQCQEVTLREEPGRQSFQVEAQDVTAVQLEIVDVYDQKSAGAGPELVSLSEVEVENRG
jgi:hypothetical protein